MSDDHAPDSEGRDLIVPDWAKKLPSPWRRWVSVALPLALALSAKASKAYAKQKLLLAEVEAFKEGQIAESKALSGLRVKLLERYIDADLSERLRIEKDLQFLDEKRRKSQVYLRAYELLDEDSGTVEPDSGAEIKSEWRDRFDELAGKNNEPWREELLAKALVSEAKSPGSIGPRALWVIGTLEEELFHAFASILDISTTIGGDRIIPKPFDMNKPIPNCELGNQSIGSLLFLLSDSNLVSDISNSSISFDREATVAAAYGSSAVQLKFKQEHRDLGVIPTQLGSRLASIYETTPNSFGQEIFDNWLATLRDTIVDQQPFGRAS